MLALTCSGFFVIAGAFALIASQISGDALPRNGDVGIRTKHTQASDEAWKAAHVTALPLIKQTAWINLIFGVIVLTTALTIPAEWVTLTLMGIGYILLFVLVWVMARIANHAAQSV